MDSMRRGDGRSATIARAERNGTERPGHLRDACVREGSRQRESGKNDDSDMTRDRRARDRHT